MERTVESGLGAKKGLRRSLIITTKVALGALQISLSAGEMVGMRGKLSDHGKPYFHAPECPLTCMSITVGIAFFGFFPSANEQVEPDHQCPLNSRHWAPVNPTPLIPMVDIYRPHPRSWHGVGRGRIQRLAAAPAERVSVRSWPLCRVHIYVEL